MQKLIVIVLALSILPFSGKVNAQNFAVPNDAQIVSEVPEIFHGTWRITGSFHAYEVVAPERYIGKTLIITTNGYEIDDVKCVPERIKLSYYPSRSTSYLNFSKHKKLPEALKKKYTDRLSISLSCSPPDHSLLSRAIYNIHLHYYIPSEQFIVFEPRNGGRSFY